MPRRVIPVPAPRRERDEQGAVAIMVAISMTALLVLVGLVIDFGLVRIDRQVNKSGADSATLAGLHALGAGDGTAHPFRGICTAVRYLQQNDDRFASIPENLGWTTGLGVATASGCTDTSLRSKTCKPGDTSSWAKYKWSGTYQGQPLEVEIDSGYDLVGATWAEDTLPASAADELDTAQGCDHLAVIVTQNRQPGFGSLATSSDLRSAVRSVGRVKQGPGGYAPAMLLLKRTGCPVLESGSASGTSFIHVLGALSSNNIAQPGSIHSDSDGNGGCSGGSNQNIFLGKGGAGIVAYAAPLVGNPTAPDTSKPGQISSVAGADGKALNYIRDLLDNAHGSSALSGPGGTKVEPSPRGQVTRSPVDDRYFGGVKPAIANAAGVFNTTTSTTAGWTKFPAAVDACKPTQANVNSLALTAASQLYVDCTTNSGFAGVGDLTIPAGKVFFNGKVAPEGNLTLTNATKVYITGKSGDGITLGGSAGQFQMHNAGSYDAVAGRCTTNRSSRRATLFLKDGTLKESNSANLLRLCNTTMFLLGGHDNGCVPPSPGAAPTSTPCPSATRGTGQFTQNGGAIDWTAPDQHDVMTLPNGDPNPVLAADWHNTAGPEDLALWTESGSSNSDTYNMSGGGVFNVRGVFMVPNAEPFIIGGGGNMNLTNAQFIAMTIALNGSTTNITMKVDPNSAITLPKLELVGLVR